MYATTTNQSRAACMCIRIPSDLIYPRRILGHSRDSSVDRYAYRTWPSTLNGQLYCEAAAAMHVRNQQPQSKYWNQIANWPFPDAIFIYINAYTHVLIDWRINEKRKKKKQGEGERGGSGWSRERSRAWSWSCGRGSGSRGTGRWRPSRRRWSELRSSCRPTLLLPFRLSSPPPLLPAGVPFPLFFSPSFSIGNYGSGPIHRKGIADTYKRDARQCGNGNFRDELSLASSMGRKVRFISIVMESCQHREKIPTTNFQKVKFWNKFPGCRLDGVARVESDLQNAFSRHWYSRNWFKIYLLCKKSDCDWQCFCPILWKLLCVTYILCDSTYILIF